MHKEILSKEQVDLLPFLSTFHEKFYLAGGTAIALHIGHRKSIDFDLFTETRPNKNQIDKQIALHGLSPDAVMVSTPDEYTLSINNVKCTFVHYPFSILATVSFEDFFSLPSLLDLAAMKAYTLGRRIAYKDYADLYFLLREYFSLQEIADRAKILFAEHFNEKLFREQLCYFEDIDTTEPIDFLRPFSFSEMGTFFEKVAIS